MQSYFRFQGQPLADWLCATPFRPNTNNKKTQTLQLITNDYSKYISTTTTTTTNTTTTAADVLKKPV
ncbi:unnamed protein product [Schistosoma turkestanicum]|nr:unnamed protein product [Schistosoma turkestanicum]